MHAAAGQGAYQVRAQAGLQAKAGQLPGVEQRGNIAHVTEGVIQRAAQGLAVPLQVFGHAPLQPLRLQLGSGEQLADVVVQFPAQMLTLVFLHLEHALGQLGRAQVDRPGAQAQLYNSTQRGDQLQHQQGGRDCLVGQVQRHVGNQ
ncbi:hypothetical protein D9M73_195750 [compost metagenome]